LLDPVGERRPFDQLHHKVIRAHVVQRADIRMIQGRDRAGFAIEALGELLL
jgi:hypothetical protein